MDKQLFQNVMMGIKIIMMVVVYAKWMMDGFVLFYLELQQVRVKERQ